MENPINPEATSDRLIVKNSHVYCGESSALQFNRILTYVDGVGATVLMVADSVAGDPDICATFDKAPLLPVAGKSLLSAFSEPRFVWGSGYKDAP